uniref:N-terminal EF-hand calcium binding protein 3 n=1 Tax=Echeneis naucrates TaxID=173247 RepID=A0A665SYH2_ECHNA
MLALLFSSVLLSFLHSNLDIDKLSDTNHTGCFNKSSLPEYFTPHLGEYVNVLSALEKLNVAILKAMDKTKEEYQGSSVLGQFVTRFLLRETSTQLQSLQSSLDCAMDAVHDQGCPGRRILKKPQDLPMQRLSKRPGRRIQKNMCLSPTDPYSGMLTTGVSVEPDNHWGSQINQLEELIDKLECEVCENTHFYPSDGILEKVRLDFPPRFQSV